jgi:hypothetical protein
MTSFFDNYDNTIQELIEEELNSILNDEYAMRIARDLTRSIIGELKSDVDERYALIDGETGQLESRTLYENLDEAEQAAKQAQHGESCLVATLLLDC